MGSAGTMGFAAIMGSEAIMGSAAPMCSSGSGRTGDRIGDRTGLPMPTRRWSSHPLLQSMSHRHHRALHCPPRSIGTIVTTRRATIRLSSSALVAGDPLLRPHHEWQPTYAYRQHRGAPAPEALEHVVTLRHAPEACGGLYTPARGRVFSRA
jgi:hypothetical protein